MNNQIHTNSALKVDREAVDAAAVDAGISDCLLFQTSGSGGRSKWAVLEPAALEVSAAAVNTRLDATASRGWLRALPEFHVGGYAIGVRARLAGADVRELEGKWDAATFAEACEGVAFASLVPTQLYDLVRLQLKPSGTLRAVLVGGAALNPKLRDAAESLGWPVMESYGMTEASSTIALDGMALDIWQLRTSSAGLLEIRGEALFEAYLRESARGWEIDRPFDRDGWFTTDDRAEVVNGRVSFLGRADAEVKVLGERVDLDALQAIVERLAGNAYAVVAIADARSGKRLVLVGETECPSLLGEFNAEVAGYERATELVRVESLPRGPLGKIRRAELTAQIVEKTRQA